MKCFFLEKGDKIKIGGNKDIYEPEIGWIFGMNDWIRRIMTIERIDSISFRVKENTFWWHINDIVWSDRDIDVFEGVDIEKELKI